MLNEVFKQEAQRSISKCLECGASDLIRDDEIGELVCKHCGTVAKSKILDYSPEWRAFNYEQREKRTRVGAPSTFTIHDRGMSTTVDWGGRDFYGRRLKPEQRVHAYRLRKWNRRSKVKGSQDRNLAYALSEITKMGYKLNLPRNIIETASMIYRKCVRRRYIRGRSIQGIAAASLYMACRQCNVIRTLQEIGDAAGLTKKQSGKHYRFIFRKLEMRIPPYEVKQFVSSYINHLQLSGYVENCAMNILDLASELRLTSGRGKAGLASAAVYIACQVCGEPRTQGQIAKRARVTEVTIRNRYKELVNNLGFEIYL